MGCSYCTEASEQSEKAVISNLKGDWKKILEITEKDISKHFDISRNSLRDDTIIFCTSKKDQKQYSISMLHKSSITNMKFFCFTINEFQEIRNKSINIYQQIFESRQSFYFVQKIRHYQSVKDAFEQHNFTFKQCMKIFYCIFSIIVKLDRFGLSLNFIDFEQIAFKDKSNIKLNGLKLASFQTLQSDLSYEYGLLQDLLFFIIQQALRKAGFEVNNYHEINSINKIFFQFFNFLYQQHPVFYLANCKILLKTQKFIMTRKNQQLNCIIALHHAQKFNYLNNIIGWYYLKYRYSKVKKFVNLFYPDGLDTQSQKVEVIFKRISLLGFNQFSHFYKNNQKLFNVPKQLQLAEFLGIVKAYNIKDKTIDKICQILIGEQFLTRQKFVEHLNSFKITIFDWNNILKINKIRFNYFTKDVLTYLFDNFLLNRQIQLVQKSYEVTLVPRLSIVHENIRFDTKANLFQIQYKPPVENFFEMSSAQKDLIMARQDEKLFPNKIKKRK